MLWSETVAQLKRAKSEKKSAISHTLSKAWCKHIQKCNLMQVVNDRLSDINLSAQAKLDTSGTAVCIEPTAGSEFVWSGAHNAVMYCSRFWVPYLKHQCRFRKMWQERFFQLYWPMRHILMSA